MLTPWTQLQRVWQYGRAVVYRKELITTGLDADTQTPAGMRHRFFASAKLSRAVLTWSRSFFHKQLAVCWWGFSRYNWAERWCWCHQGRKKQQHFFRKATIFSHCLPCFSSIFKNWFQIKLKVLCEEPDHFPMCFCPHALLWKETDWHKFWFIVSEQRII